MLVPVAPSTRPLTVCPADLRTAAVALGRAAAETASTPTRILVGSHDTHAASLDAACDDFRAAARREMHALVAHAEALSELLAAAAARFSGLESVLAALLAP